MKDALIVSAVRTAVGKAPNGALRSTRPDELGAAAVREALDRVTRNSTRNRLRMSSLVARCRRLSRA